MINIKNKISEFWDEEYKRPKITFFLSLFVLITLLFLLVYIIITQSDKDKLSFDIDEIIGAYNFDEYDDI